jgi:hypothetical protein
MSNPIRSVGDVANSQSVSRKGRGLSHNKIKDDAPGAPVAKYLYGPIMASGLSINELSKILEYSQHSNVSMVKNGLSRLPVVKILKVVSCLDVDAYKLASLVLENNHPTYPDILKRAGLICDKWERGVLNQINKAVPLGERKEFAAKLEAFLKDNT